MKKVCTLIMISTLISGCSIYRESESIQDKIARYHSKERNVNPVPYIVLPAGKKTPAVSKKSPSVIPTNSKKLYFTTLYRQFAYLKSYTSVSNNLNHCPAFHNVFLKEKNAIQNPKREISSTKVEKLKKTSPLTALIESKDLKLNNYVTSTLDELNEFCHTGTSLNYYNFANVMTHIKNNNQHFHANVTKSMRALLKTTVFANRAIITGLKSVEKKGRFPASSVKAKSYLNDENLDDALGTYWSAEILDNL